MDVLTSTTVPLYATIFRGGAPASAPAGASAAAAAATAGDASSNRIVAPNGVFSLYLRIYWPDESALDGTWTPPPVHPVASSLQQAGT